MLEAAGRYEEQADGAVSAGPAPLPDLCVVASPGGRYGDGRRISLASATGVILAHLAVFFAAAWLSPQFVREETHRLRVVEIKLDPPPAEPKPNDPPKIKTPPEVRPLMQQVAAPQMPVPAAAIVTMPDVQPAPPPVAAPAPAPPAPPLPPPTVQGGNLGAQMLSGKPPRYPIESRRKREQGTVLLALVVGQDGRVMSISIARSSGFDRLDSAARDAVKSWRWAPQIRDGQPVMVKGVVEIPFVISG